VKAVSNSIKTIVKTKDMVIDERLGIIIMRDTPEAIRMAERIVALQDLGDPEVMLEVEVLEIKRSRLLELGVKWPGQATLAPLQIEPGVPLTLSGLRALTWGTTQVGIGGVVVNARKEDQDGNILANPRIRVRNKEKAKVLIGDRVPIITTTTSPATNANYVSEAVNYIDVGLKLEVEPVIYLDDEVAIKVNLEVSTLVREVLSKAGTLAYQIGTRGANTVLRLKDGETQILAGLISDEDRATSNKVPGLGELPVMGRLFGSQKDDSQRSEILLSITPRVVRSIHRPDLLDAEFDSGTEAVIGAEPLRLSVVEPADKPEAAAASKPSAAVPSPASVVVPPLVSASPPLPVVAPAKAVAPQSATSSAGGAPAPVMSWQLPAQVKAGEQFTAVLRVKSQAALRGLPLLIGFDPQALQVAGVQEGDFFKQVGGAVQFSHRIDPAQGKIFVAAVRQNVSGNDAGVNGDGAVVMVGFKALKATSGAGARVQLLSASPEPAPGLPVAVPVEQWVRVTP
jgi:general secretion pathway protein D